MDEVDISNERIDAERQALILRNARPLAPGVPGECQYCGEYSLRLVGEACARCRDRRGLP